MLFLLHHIQTNVSYNLFWLNRKSMTYSCRYLYLKAVLWSIFVNYLCFVTWMENRLIGTHSTSTPIPWQMYFFLKPFVSCTELKPIWKIVNNPFIVIFSEINNNWFLTRWAEFDYFRGKVKCEQLKSYYYQSHVM